MIRQWFKQPAARLLMSLCAMAMVWLVVLPRIAQQSDVARRLQWLEEKKIDPSAMYYTELEVMEQILENRRRSRR